MAIDLFGVRPRRKPRVLMHVCDAGYDCAIICRFLCARCGHETDWIEMRTVTEAKAGVPCPKCNPGEQGNENSD